MENTTLRTQRSRPIGITVIALLLAIEGILAVILALFAGLVAVVSTPFALIGTIFAVLIGLVCLVLAYGLWTLKPWAFTATVVVQALSLFFTLFNFVAMLPKNTLGTTIGNLIFPVAVLIYLFVDKNVRSAFRS